MADVRPFRGLRYSPGTAGDLTDLICPPYDVISPDAQTALQHASPHNAVHLELPSGEGEEKYERAADTLNAWRHNGVLVRDTARGYYILRHRFAHRGTTLERWGLTACVRLEEYERQVVLPHEETRSAPKEDRFKLMEACKTGMSPILSMYRDPEQRIKNAVHALTRAQPTVIATYDGDQDLAMWTVEASRLDGDVTAGLHDAPLFIADGHHRYETSLRYRDHARQRAGTWSEDDAFNYVMMTLVEFDDPGLLLLPYNRTIGGMDPPTLTAVRNRLLEVFRLQAFDTQPATPGALEEAVTGQEGRGAVLGLLGPDGEGPYLLTLEQGAIQEELLALPGGSALKDSEGWVLHQAVLDHVLGASAGYHVTYQHNPQEAWHSVVQGRQQMAFFLRPFPMDLFQAVVSTGQLLPSKSTYFHPKLPTGLVFNPLYGEL